MVLLKNNDNLLPPGRRDPGSPVRKGQLKGGGGSGDVTVAYVRRVYDGLKAENVPVYEPLSDFYRDYGAQRYAAGDAPGLMAKAELPGALVRDAEKAADVAVIVLSRFSGEGWDREPIMISRRITPGRMN